MASPGDCSRDGCSYGFLEYEPSLAGNAVLLAFFAVLFPIALLLGIRYKILVFTTIIITGILLEIVGYAGRVLLTRNDNTYKVDFVLSQLGTMIAPTIISLAVFRLLPPIVAVYGDQYRAWRPNWHNVVFYAFTTICVILQVVGSILSTVFVDDFLNGIGDRLLVAGLAVHVLSLLVFTFFGVRFALAVQQRRGVCDQSSRLIYNALRFKAFLFALCIATLLLVTRTVYRLVAFAEGSSSALAKNEILFLVLDGFLVFVAVALLLALFPARILSSSSDDSTYHPHEVTQRAVHRPAPIQLERTSYNPQSNRVSLKSSMTTSPRTPRKSMPPPPPKSKNMVDSEQLW